ncbi:MAG: hypothetical protein BGN89_09655 [Alphaproteobacteria bacterium 64-6]|nr:MAG: hypothetical protein BGN89_09655 [Alphaproteobacteria bacterium 64-6]
MTMLKQMMIAIAVLVALSAPSSAKTLADEIWDQINQTMPNRPSADEFRDAPPLGSWIRPPLEHGDEEAYSSLQNKGGLR